MPDDGGMPASKTLSPVLVALGQAVRQARKERGFSQESFAVACGIDRAYMGGVERGERNVAMVNVARIVAALDMKPSDFFKALDGTIVADHEEKGP